MKSKILTLLVLLISAFVLTANGESIKLVIQQSNGETTSLKLNDNPVVTFAGDNLVATTQANSVNIPLTNVNQIKYETSQQFVAVDQSRGQAVCHMVGAYPGGSGQQKRVSQR